MGGESAEGPEEALRAREEKGPSVAEGGNGEEAARKMERALRGFDPGRTRVVIFTPVGPAECSWARGERALKPYWCARVLFGVGGRVFKAARRRRWWW